MSTDANSFTDKWSGFLTSLWTQIRAAMVVGLPADVAPDSRYGCDGDVSHQSARRAIRLSGNYSGRLTRNGLGSLDIGGGRSGIDE